MNMGSTPAEVTADAKALHEALSDLVRVYQFRDRDRICCYDISVTQCYALEALAGADGMTLGQLAAQLYLDKSTASRVVDALVAKGYAERRPHPQDGRALQLVISAQGRHLYERIDADLLGEVEAVVAGFPPDVRGALHEMLGRLTRAAAARMRGETCCS